MRITGKLVYKPFIEELKADKVNVLNSVESRKEKFKQIVDKTTKPLVPILTGTLRSSLFIVPERQGDLFILEFGYAAIDPEDGYNYAEVQHNNLSFYHPRGGQALYLWEGMQESEALIIKELNEAISEGLNE